MDLNSISVLQQQLQTMLGTDYNSYLENVRDWFGQRVTKDFFDEQLSFLLKDGALEVHNEMMKQIIFQCNGTPAPPPALTFSINIHNHNPKNKANNLVARNSNDSNGEDKEFLSSATVKSTTTSIIQQQQQQQSNGNDNRGGIFIYNQGGGTSYVEESSPNYITLNVVGDSDEAMVDQEEPDAKPIDVDWLFNADIVKVVHAEVGDGDEPMPLLPPENYSKFALEHHPSEIIRSPCILPNVTHGYDIADRLNKFPQLKVHFKQQPKDQPHLSAGASIHGRFLLKAWECGLDGVETNCTRIVLDAVKEHVRRIVTEIVKQRRSFRMRGDKICHSIGAPYPNPYLLQGQHLIDCPFTSETIKMTDVLQVPSILPTADELERIAILQTSAACSPPKDCRFPATRATLADLLIVIENDPGIIPYTNLRFKLLAGIRQNYKGFGGTYNEDEDEDDDYEDHTNLLPICSY